MSATASMSWPVSVCALTAAITVALLSPVAMAQDAPPAPTEEPAPTASPAAPAPATPAAPTPPAADPATGTAAGAATPAGAGTAATPVATPVATPAIPTAGVPTPSAGTVTPKPRLVAPLPPPEDDLPIPTLTIDRIPPNTSYEFGLQASFGQVAFFRDVVPPWIGFGFRGGWGKNFGAHRVGFTGLFSAEGAIGVHSQLSIEPSVTWDYISRPGLLVGAGAGPALSFLATNSTVESEYAFDVAPSLAARFGWSETWSRVGRRLFVVAEPKVRFAAGRASPLVAIVVGSGGGR